MSQFGKYTSDVTLDKEKENGHKLITNFYCFWRGHRAGPRCSTHPIMEEEEASQEEEGPCWGLQYSNEQVKACGSNQTCFAEHAPHSEKNPRAKGG